MHYAHQPLNQPVDMDAPTVKQALSALIWEEIRPLQRLELVWDPDKKTRPSPEDISVTTLNRKGNASSWWNNLLPETKNLRPTVSTDGKTYAYDLQTETCGLVISVNGDKRAAEYQVPSVRALVADKWKQMDFEIEWGYEPDATGKDYHGTGNCYCT